MAKIAKTIAKSNQYVEMSHIFLHPRCNHKEVDLSGMKTIRLVIH